MPVFCGNGHAYKKINTMKTLVLFIITLFTSANANPKDADNSFMQKLEYIRTNYYASVEEEEIVEKVEQYINRHFGEDLPSLILAYKAALLSVKSKHAFWPGTKLEYFNESMDLFEKAVVSDPDNLEIRFLRFTILHHIPSFLGHSDERNKDMLVILKELAKKDYSMIKPDIQKGIAEFLLRTGRLNQAQEKKLYSYYPDAKP